MHAAGGTGQTAARPGDGKTAPPTGIAQSAGGIRLQRNAEASSREDRDHSATSAHPHGWLYLQHLERADDPVREGHWNSVYRRVRECFVYSAARIRPILFCCRIASDRSLEVYFREHIFAPLSMSDTGFLISSAQKARVAPMFSRDQDGTLKPMAFEMPQRPEFFMGGGALFSTPRNYMAFLQMLLRDGTFNGAQVLKPETVALMRQNHIGDLNVQTLKTIDPAS